jgi:DNA repair exonuclease SbcCD nuclease subunit
MRLVHLSDLHLGYRQYQRLTPTGVNQREADVAATFRLAVDRVIELRPELVIVAGDVFHTVRPTNQAILHAFLQFNRLAVALPDSKIILVAGNHDTPRSSETGGILQLFAQLGLFVVDRQAERLSFPDLDLSVLAVPDVPGIVKPTFNTDPNARFNVLALHGEIPGLSDGVAWDRAPLEVSLEELNAAQWDYVALGHCHVYRQIRPNAYYAGSIDYTSLNTWGEKAEERDAGLKGKGFVERDLLTGEQTFHLLDTSRPLVDLQSIKARDLTAADIDQRVRALVDACVGGIDDKIVRLTVWDIPRHIARELDHKSIREYKRRALSFQLDLRRPELNRITASGSPARRPSLNEMVREKLMTRPIDADIDRDALIERAIAYLDEAQVAAVVSTPPAPIEA